MSAATTRPTGLPAADTVGSGRALQLTGSTTLLPRMQRAAEAYMISHAEHRIVINGGCGTARGYKALLDGTTDIAMASGAVPLALASAAAERGLAFRETIVTRDAILPVVHASNPLDTLSLVQLRNIFNGRIFNWRNLGGPDAAIEVLVGPPSGGVTNSWRKQILGDDDTYTPLARVLGADDRLARVAAHPLAITYVPQMAIPMRHLKILRVDGMSAEQSPLAYSLHAPMMLVTLGTPSPLSKQFIAFAAIEGTAAAAGANRE